MDLGGLTRGNTTRNGDGPAVRESNCVGVELADFAGLGSGDLVKLILQVDSARRQLDGYLAALLGRFADLEGQEAVEELCRQFGLGRYRARQHAKTANALNALPDTLEASKQGWISIEHARVMGESHQRAPMAPEQEIELVTLAIKEDLDQFKKTAARLEDQRQADGGLSRMEQQKQRRSGKVFDGDNDMVVMHAEFDRVAGERVKTSLFALADRMFREDSQSGSGRTHEQRTADALVALITQQPKGGGRAGRDTSSDADHMGGSSYDQSGCGELTPQATTLIVTVGYDTLSGQLKNAEFIDGTPIEVDELRHIACGAGIVPAIFAGDGQPLYMGRKQRAITAAQKLALYVRDKRCVGCGMRASACDAHHIIWWDNDGPTDITNLVLLCPKCHKKVHKQGYVVNQDSRGRHQLRPPPGKRARSPGTSDDTGQEIRHKSLHQTNGHHPRRSAVLSGK